MANINIRIDQQTKSKAELVFAKLGLNPTTAITLFYNQVIRTNSIPFDLKLDVPNKKTIKAIKEVDKLEANQRKAETFTNIDDLTKDLLK